MDKQRGKSTVQVWHDEMQRFEATGRLDEGPCWCATERRAVAIEESGFHAHDHCESCDQDGEYPCCRALRDADSAS